jgi:capsular polysaccharide biosynthesis protein
MIVDVDRSSALGILSSVVRHPVLVAVTALVVAALGYVASSLQAPSFTATARLFLTSSAPFNGVGEGSYVNDPTRYVINQAEIAMSQPVMRRAVASEDLGVSATELVDAVVVTPGRNTDVLHVEATAPTREQAMSWADAVAEAYRATQADAVRRQTAELLALSPSDEEAVLSRAAVYGDGVGLVETAVRPQEPSSPRPLRDAALAGIAGLALGLLLAWATDAVRRRPSLDLPPRLTSPRRPEGQASPQTVGETGVDPRVPVSR